MYSYGSFPPKNQTTRPMPRATHSFNKWSLGGAATNSFDHLQECSLQRTTSGPNDGHTTTLDQPTPRPTSITTQSLRNFGMRETLENYTLSSDMLQNQPVDN